MNIDKNFNNLKDTLIKVPDGEMNGSITFDLDIDKNSIIDLSIVAVKSYSSMYVWEQYIQLTPKNDFQLSYIDYADTLWRWNPTLPDKIYEYEEVIIPKMFDLGDTIKFENKYTPSSMMITYYQNPGGANQLYRGEISRRAWLNAGYKYIALRQIKGDNVKLAWIKLNVISNSSLILNSCNFFLKNSEIIIPGYQ